MAISGEADDADVRKARDDYFSRRQFGQNYREP
jgi:hypothetical protein